MSETFALQVEKREQKGRHGAAAVRTEEKLPAVVYGHGVESYPVAVNTLAFEKLFEKAGESSLIALSVDGAEPVNVVVHDVQRHAVTHRITHVDFYQVNMNEVIHTEVPLVFEGVAPAEKTLGGILVKSRDHVTIECLPGDLIHDIVVDLTVLETFSDHIRVENLVVPDTVKIMDDVQVTIVSVSEPRSQEELEALEEEVSADVDAVEVEGAKEGEEAEGGEEAAAE